MAEESAISKIYSHPMYCGNPFKQIFESMYSCSTVSSHSHILILETHKYGLNSIKDSLITN